MIRIASLAIPLSLIAFPSFAQWGGLGDPGWGWEPKTCHYCIEGVELSASGSIADGEAIRGRVSTPDPGGAIVQTTNRAPEGEAFGGGLRIGFGPRIFLDAGYTQISLESEGSSFVATRDYQHVRYGIGGFVFHEPGVAALYVRAGGAQISSEMELSLLGDPSSTGINREGFSREVDVGDLSAFGGGIGGMWIRGKLRIEASYSWMGDINEGSLSLTRFFNKRLGLQLRGDYLSLSGLDVAPVSFGQTQTDDRSVLASPPQDEAVLSYGLGLLFSF